MKRRNKIILSIFIVLLTVVSVILYVATKKPKSGADSNAVVEMNATDFYNKLNTDYKKIDSLYLNKNIAISGKIKDINQAHVFIEGSNDFLINCSFDSTNFEKINTKVKVGDIVSIKGIYSGCNGFDTGNIEGLDMLSGEKTAELKTCGINHK
jgi:uncharacterized FlgJ-related protein